MAPLNAELKPRKVRRREGREGQNQLGKNSNLLIDAAVYCDILTSASQCPPRSHHCHHR